MMKNQQVVFSSFGPPQNTVEIQENTLPKIAPDEILLKTLYAPINPADLNYIEGRYGIRPSLPAIPGNEASAEVIEKGCNVKNYKEGDRVFFIHKHGLWQRFNLAKEGEVIKASPKIDLQQLAMLKVNPLTAWRLLFGFSLPSRDTWVVQNAANSSVGQAVIQIAHAHHIRTLNLVRQKEKIVYLKNIGADLCFADEESTLQEIKENHSTLHPALALNAVGGASALRLMKLLQEEGIHITYGAMSRKSVTIPNKFLIFKRLHFQGLWISPWLERTSQQEIVSIYQKIMDLLHQDKLRLPIEKIYPLQEVHQALQHAQLSGRSGKILLQF